MYGCTAFPWIGPGRTSATWIVRSSIVSGFVRSRLCICARLSIWNTPTVSAAWISANTAGSSSGMRERSIGAPWSCAIRSTHSSTHESIPSPSRSILRKPASAHESLSHWQSWRPAIAAGCTGTSSTSGRDEITIPPGCWETWRGRPAISRVRNWNARQRFERSLLLGVGERRDLVRDALGVPAVGHAGEPLELGLRQPERLADVADRAPRAVRREARDERGVLVPVALGDADDQLLADVAREVEVDVRHGRELVVEEAPEREAVLDRVDVREPGQVADDRADRAAPPRPGGRNMRGESRPRTSSAHSRAISSTSWWRRKNPASPSFSISASSPSRRARASACNSLSLAPYRSRERVLADRGELADRGVGAVGEVGVAVAELLGEVERRAARRARRCARRPRGRSRRSARPSPPAPAAPPRGSRAARARTRRARCGSGSRRARPGAACGAARAHGRCPSRSSRRRGARRGRGAARDAARRPARTAAAARRRTAPGRTRAASRAAPCGSWSAEPVAGAAREADEPLVQLGDGLERRRRAASRLPVLLARDGACRHAPR